MFWKGADRDVINQFVGFYSAHLKRQKQIKINYTNTSNHIQMTPTSQEFQRVYCLLIQFYRALDIPSLSVSLSQTDGVPQTVLGTTAETTQ